MPANIGNLAEMGRRFRARKSGQGNKRINTRVLDVHNLTHNAIKKGIQEAVAESPVPPTISA